MLRAVPYLLPKEVQKKLKMISKEMLDNCKGNEVIERCIVYLSLRFGLSQQTFKNEVGPHV